jgi:para-nitrobenzyl esterase
VKERVIGTHSGRVRGYERDGMFAFLGIPYARPPIGELRFKRAQAVTPWDGILDAKSYGPPSVQLEGGKVIGSEECLTLNIQRPVEEDHLPVLIWIHGGGYNTGSTDCPMTDGRNFVRQGICFVSLQYRLNVLGFYDFTTYPGCGDFDSNCGFSDQLMALQWIHENIAFFGGDPENVTIMGESAGASSCVNLMAAPAASGYFQKAIIESALPECVMTHEMARENLDLFIEGMGWTEADLPKLKTMDAALMQKGNSYVAARQQYKNPGMFLPGPVIDDLLPEYPSDAILKGSASKVKVLIGTNLHEATMFVHPEETCFPNSWEMVEEMMKKNGYEEEYPAFRRHYEQSGDDAFIDFSTDYAFQWGGLKLALSQSRFNDVYMYRYELVTKAGRENGMRASHAFELPAVFGDRDFAFSHFVFDGEEEAVIRDIFQAMQLPWANFVRSSSPDEGWERFAENRQMVRLFDRHTRDAELDRSALLRLWGDKTFYRM